MEIDIQAECASCGEVMLEILEVQYQPYRILLKVEPCVRCIGNAVEDECSDEDIKKRLEEAQSKMEEAIDVIVRAKDKV
jgi:hypothetical protein